MSPKDLNKSSKPQKDLTGKVFGRLTVIEDAGVKNRSRYWHCKCTCGNTKAIRGSSLANGETRSCGCLQVESVRNRNVVNDVHAGDRFGLLVTIERKSNTLWRCQCDCGEQKDVHSFDLKREHVKSCGCLRKSNVQISMQNYREKNNKAGAHVPSLKRKVGSNNSTGVKGVGRMELPNGSIKYTAYLTINGKTYRAGYYDTIEDATAARKALEEKHHKPFLENN
ncbi:hypothetical protein [Thermoactinomyces sp. DSM 45892]|uniref:hypothetical protein n=1 Tax=Thermoactinomyces sp. DSM 45892 TaxID=1882753 RepID=UPI00089556F6|nr:hypothetical protein [Thermoactinomyces sp. DSM 45892]SDX94318.1 hypothetical protein SAMN05444416_10167 [Thermoactinomyces sp. DSM 45892]